MHLTENELASLTHGDPSSVSQEARAHLASCAECGARVDSLRAMDRETAQLLRSLDHPIQALRSATIVGRVHQRRRRVAAIAAGLTLFVAAAAAALPGSPLRHVLLRVLGRAEPNAWASTPPLSAESAPARQLAGISFVPGTTLEIRFEDPASRSRVRIVFTGATQVSASADGDAAFSIRHGQVVVNDRGSAMNVTLEIPRNISDVIVKAGDAIVFHKEAEAVSGEAVRDRTGVYTVDLGRAGLCSRTYSC